jgi:hypothetical protein
MLSSLGKLLIGAGLVLVGIGLLMSLGGKIPFFGKLPGDFKFQNRNMIIYFPFTTMLLLSVLVSIVFWIISKLK